MPEQERTDQMSVSVLAESNFDGMFLTTLLAAEQKAGAVEIGVVSGLASCYSFARTMLAVKRIPVAVVIDADSPEPEVASERKCRAEEVLADAAGGVPFRVIVAVPELEALFFRRPNLLKKAFGKRTDKHVIELALLSPRHAIRKLAPGEPYEQARFRLLRAMTAADVKALRETDLIQDLLDFVKVNVEYSNRSVVSKA
jgi:hypothetical protein